MSTQNIDAFATALSGLTAQQSKLEMIGNNIANMNTIGFKAGRMTFAEQLGQTVGIGYTPFSQGTFQSTGNTTDLAINGKAFFVVQGEEEHMFTRAGNFRFNGDGKLVNSDGLAVQGWMSNINSDAQGATLLGDIVIDQNMVSEAQATQNVWLSGNLNSNLQAETEVWTSQGTITIEGGDPADVTTELNSLTQTTTDFVTGDTIEVSGTNADGDPVSATFTYGTDGTTVGDLINTINTAFGGSATAAVVEGRFVLTDATSGNSSTTIELAMGDSNTGVSGIPTSFTETNSGYTPIVTTSMVVYDAQGGAHDLTVEFEKTDVNGEWKVNITANGNETINSGGSGTVSFDSSGQLLGFTFDNGATALSLDPGNGTPEMILSLNLDGAEGFSGLSQYDSVSNLSMRDQDGRETGSLTNYTIDPDGTINGEFSNGESLTLAQIGVAKFTDPSGLNVISGSLFAIPISGDAQIGKADELGSEIQSGVLEMSNVDLANQFTKMIEAQRAFQAASRVVTTLDEVLSEVSRLKR